MSATQEHLQLVLLRPLDSECPSCHLAVLAGVEQQFLARNIEGPVDLRLRARCRALARVSHPSLVPMLDLIERDDGAWVVEGSPVSGHARVVIAHSRRSRRRVPPQIVLSVGIQLCEALEALHACTLPDDEGPLLHLAICPRAIRATADGRVRLGRYAVQRQGPPTASERLYLSPEMLRGTPDGPRSDLFSLGTVLFEMFVGQPLFTGGKVRSALLALGREESSLQPAPASTAVVLHKALLMRALWHLEAIGLPQGVSDIFQRVLSFEPAARHPSAAAFRADLELLLSKLPTMDVAEEASTLFSEALAQGEEDHHDTSDWTLELDFEGDDELLEFFDGEWSMLDLPQALPDPLDPPEPPPSFAQLPAPGTSPTEADGPGGLPDTLLFDEPLAQDPLPTLIPDAEMVVPGVALPSSAAASDAAPPPSGAWDPDEETDVPDTETVVPDPTLAGLEAPSAGPDADPTDPDLAPAGAAPAGLGVALAGADAAPVGLGVALTGADAAPVGLGVAPTGPDAAPGDPFAAPGDPVAAPASSSSSPASPGTAPAGSNAAAPVGADAAPAGSDAATAAIAGAAAPSTGAATLTSGAAVPAPNAAGATSRVVQATNAAGAASGVVASDAVLAPPDPVAFLSDAAPTTSAALHAGMESAPSGTASDTAPDVPVATFAPDVAIRAPHVAPGSDAATATPDTMSSTPETAPGLVYARPDPATEQALAGSGAIAPEALGAPRGAATQQAGARHPTQRPGSGAPPQAQGAQGRRAPALVIGLVLALAVAASMIVLLSSQ